MNKTERKHFFNNGWFLARFEPKNKETLKRDLYQYIGNTFIIKPFSAFPELNNKDYMFNLEFVVVENLTGSEAPTNRFFADDFKIISILVDKFTVENDFLYHIGESDYKNVWLSKLVITKEETAKNVLANYEEGKFIFPLVKYFFSYSEKQAKRFKNYGVDEVYIALIEDVKKLNSTAFNTIDWKLVN